jgi:hypothetical protein
MPASDKTNACFQPAPKTPIIKPKRKNVKGTGISKAEKSKRAEANRPKCKHGRRLDHPCKECPPRAHLVPSQRTRVWIMCKEHPTRRASRCSCRFCEHGTIKADCRLCVGPGAGTRFCDHGRQKTRCPECALAGIPGTGSGMCIHSRGKGFRYDTGLPNCKHCHSCTSKDACTSENPWSVGCC